MGMTPRYFLSLKVEGLRTYSSPTCTRVQQPKSSKNVAARPLPTIAHYCSTIANYCPLLPTIANYCQLLLHYCQREREESASGRFPPKYRSHRRQQDPPHRRDVFPRVSNTHNNTFTYLILVSGMSSSTCM